MFGFVDFVDCGLIDVVISNFMQSQYSWFVVVGVDCWIGVFGQLVGVFGCYQYQFEMVVDYFKVVFYGNVCYVKFLGGKVIWKVVQCIQGMFCW